MDRRTLLAATAALAGMLLMSPAFADEAANVEVVKAYVGAWNAHSVDNAVGYFADDVVYFDASVGEPVNGKAAATTDVVGSFINAVPDLKWEIKGEPIAQGDKVAFEWTFSGTNTGAWADGTEAANLPFSFTGATVMTVKDGLIRTQSDYYDALGFFEQLGWMEE